MYDRLKKAHGKGEPVPQLVTAVPTEISDVPQPGNWAPEFEDTVVHIERVIAYWSRILKSAERNYSPTEREALALCEGLIKFQPYIEGEKILAITGHATLTWSCTYQNVGMRAHEPRRVVACTKASLNEWRRRETVRRLRENALSMSVLVARPPKGS